MPGRKTKEMTLAPKCVWQLRKRLALTKISEPESKQYKTRENMHNNLAFDHIFLPLICIHLKRMKKELLGGKNIPNTLSGGHALIFALLIY